MIGTNIFGSSSFLILGASAHVGNLIHHILLFLSITMGATVLTSFIVTSIIKKLIK